MIKFKPVGYSQFYDFRSNLTLIKSLNLGSIYSPYPGVVNKTYSDDCEGFIEIKHEIEDSTYYSIFCNVDKIIVRQGDIVRSGDVIGHTKLKDTFVTYNLIKDERKINPTNFFRNNRFIGDVNKKKDNDDKPHKIKNKKSYNNNYYSGDSSSGRLLSNLLLSPLNFVGKNLEKGIDTVKDEVKNLKYVKL